MNKTLSIAKPAFKAAMDFAEAPKKAGRPPRIFNAPQGYRRLTINLPEETHKKLKHMAVDQETTATAIIEELLAKHL
jgi:hypothetical protein